MSTYNSRAAVQSIMAIAESENSKPGRVTMPKVFLGVGIFDVIAMGVGIYFSLRFKEIIPAVIFSILALLGIFLIIGFQPTDILQRRQIRQQQPLGSQAHL